ncbi:uncharacterized protein BP5553_06466 [Venustampulla echinocandica]|uniref:NACHT-NTPase and P-loop NTPases N-terminal domain-containing protein n=1 Tax=Venustampulla echinocandica TaxID=2656787 RepID=A0A370TK08_9HELO|nr:uncharacterized protein BP5553_06466 [Venustampulla echinocandica]RDL35854.1 hypothetical protein BP5553_06466 [Venustampulla echinocandica]
MAEAFAVVGLVAAIIQFAEFSSKIVERLQDFHSSVDEVPKAFRDIKVELPLLLDTLKRTQAQAESGDISRETQEALLPVVKGCRSQVDLLDSTLVKALPKPGDSSWRRGMRAFSSVGKEKKVEQITSKLHKYVQTLTYHQVTGPAKLVIRPSKPCFIMPFDRDQSFVGRGDILEEIQSRFNNQRRVALAGIGGVGKSQIAIEYCYKWHERHPQGHVIWMHASTQARLDQAYRGVARKLHLADCDNPETNIFEMVFEWLCDEDHGPWLLVVDNADDIETFFGPTSDTSQVRGKSAIPLAKFLPRSPDGSMIITTRDKRIGDRLADRAKTIMVLPMVNREADNLLRLTVPIQSGSEESESKELLDALGYLPLAITQAAAFINENTMTVVEYLEAFYSSNSELQELLSQDLGDPRRDLDTQNSITRTWKLSFDQISRQKPRAAELLSLMSVLDRQGIPKTLLQNDNEQGIEFTTALGTLQAFSLIGIEKGGTKYEMHRLVQLSTQNWLELQGTKAKWQAKALGLLAGRFPSGEYETWNECEVLLPHAEAVVGYTSTTGSHLLQYAELLQKLARYDTEQGRYNISHSRLTKSLTVREAVLGEEHTDTLVSMNDLAVVLNYQGKYGEAEAMHRRALELRQTGLGEEHQDTLISINNLAVVLVCQRQVRRGRGDIPPGARAMGGGARGGAPVYINKYGQPSSYTRNPEQVRRGRGDKPPGARAMEGGARGGAPVYINKYGQPSSYTRNPEQVRRGRGDIPPGTRAKADGAQGGAPGHSSEYK